MKTQRFVLRSLRDADASVEYLGWLNDPVANAFIESTSTTWDRERLRMYIRDASASSNTLFFGIFVADGNRHIGNIKFEKIDLESKSAVLGVLVGDVNWRGKGVFGEIFPVLQRYLYDAYGIRRIFLGVNSANEAAISAYRKAGFFQVPRQMVFGEGPIDALAMEAHYDA